MSKFPVLSARALATAMAIGVAGACGDHKLGPSVPAIVARVSGDSQSVLVGDRASAPLVVQVRNSDGSPLPNVPVRWAVTAGGGSLTTVEDTTDVDGNARSTYLSPAVVGTAKVTAVAGEQSGVFTVRLAPDTVGIISAYDGNGSAAVVGKSLTLIARATDRFGNAMRGVAVNWSSSSGALQLASGVTDSTGKTSNVIVVGPDTGQVSVLASSRFNAITFTVSALASP